MKTKWCKKKNKCCQPTANDYQDDDDDGDGDSNNDDKYIIFRNRK